MYCLDQHHQVMRRPQRRRRNKAGPTLHLMKRRGERKRRSRKATRRRAENTKRSMGKIRRRNRRGNRNHLPPLPPAPVNPQIVTETHLWCRAQGIPIIFLYSMQTVVCRRCGNMAPRLVLYKCHLQEQRFTKCCSSKNFTPRWKWKMFGRTCTKPRNMFRYIISFSFQAHCHFTFGICCVQRNLWWHMVHGWAVDGKKLLQ